MFFPKLTKRIIILLTMFLIGLLGAWAMQTIPSIAATTTDNPAAVVQNAGSNAPAAITAPDSLTWVNCTPDNVAVFSNRIHVHCKQSYSGIRYFAYPTSDAASVARVLSVLISAQVAGHTLQILYDPADRSGSSYGCNVSDCRHFEAVALH